jgi:hypothetical protein
MILVLAIVAILPLFAVGTAAHKRGVDQTHVALIAPRIAARLQEGLFDVTPKNVRDGTWEEYGQTFKYDAFFTRLEGGGRTVTPCSDAAFLLKVEVKWTETGHPRSESYQTVVLRKFPR